MLSARLAIQPGALAFLTLVKKRKNLRAEFEIEILQASQNAGKLGGAHARMRAGLPAGAEPSGRHDGVEPCSVMWGALWVQNPG